MGDYRITIEAMGGHGCGRNAADGEVVTRCNGPSCPDCRAIAFVRGLKESGNVVKVATLEHWPVPGAAGGTRTENPGPIDDLLEGTRRGTFSPAPGEPYIGPRKNPPAEPEGPGPSVVVDSGAAETTPQAEQ